uniref:Biogenesis of lysosome-related organelles complex 1 subunit 7 n=1 Tax=Timema cristinae TaxID=61476 RepID=A0A7R9DAH9_TIMCR|nr:unnamed protein product [Timema cristinae]
MDATGQGSIMDLDTESTTTSIDDKTEDFGENPTRDTLAEGLMCLLKSTIDQLDERVRATRISQVELKQQIESLSNELKKISEVQQCPLEFDLYVRKLLNAKLKVTVVSNILQTAQMREMFCCTVVNLIISSTIPTCIAATSRRMCEYLASVCSAGAAEQGSPNDSKRECSSENIIRTVAKLFSARSVVHVHPVTSGRQPAP